jgi:hypothetical protein
MIMTHVQTDGPDAHLAGLVSRIGKKAAIITAMAPDDGHGAGFPLIDGVIVDASGRRTSSPR